MKIIQAFLFFGISLFFLSYLSSDIFANAPDLIGHIKTNTGAPISGASVFWEDGRGQTRDPVQTDASGKFFFVSWQNSGHGSGWGCGENPHRFTVQAAGFNCGAKGGVSFGNGGANLDIGDIACEPVATPTPTPTPTLTPTPTPLSCGSPCDPATTNQCPLSCGVCVKVNETAVNYTCQAACNCDGVETSGLIAAGQELAINTYAKVENPDVNIATVLNMVYHVFKNGTEVATSSEIPASAPTRMTAANGILIDRYSTAWNYTVPADGSGLTKYTIKAQTACGYKTAVRRVSPKPNEIAAENMLLASISKIVNTAKLFLGLGPDRQTLALQQAKDYQSQVLGTNTLQLTTFNPATNIQQKCSEVSFELNY